MASPLHSALSAPLVALCLGAIALAWPAAAPAVNAEARQKQNTTPRLVVQTKPGERSYSIVRTPKIPVLMETRGRCDEGDRLESASLRIDGQRLEIEVDREHRSYSTANGSDWRTHQLDLPTAALAFATGGKPLAENVERERLSAVAMCNRELAKRTGAARERMLSDGQNLLARPGLTASFYLGCSSRRGPKRLFHEYVTVSKTVQAGVDAIVHCAPMVAANTPQPRTESETRGAPPRPGRPLQPAIESVQLRAEVSRQQACPDTVRLIGTIAARAPSRGSYIFMGDGYLSDRGEYAFDAAGRRNVVAVRRIDWTKVPRGLAAGPGAQRSVKGWVQFNVQPQGADRPRTSERVPFTVTCNAAPAPGKATR